MKILNLKSDFRDSSRICESFGLSRSGKTTYLKSISDFKEVYTPFHNPTKKIIPFLFYLISHPIYYFQFFYIMNSNWIVLKNLKWKDYIKIFFMRNSYLSAVFGRYEQLKDIKREIIVDEFFLQSLFIIFQVKVKEEELEKILKIIPLPAKIFLFEIPKQIRDKRLNETEFPGEKINKEYAKEWMKNSEYNYKIIKKILLKKYYC